MIPKTFHRVWLSTGPEDRIPERFQEFWHRLQELHPSWSFITWDETSALNWLRNRELFESFPAGRASYALRADVLRYEVLARFGGIYLDTDVEPLRPFNELLTDERPFIGWCSDRELDPAVIASPAGHPAIDALVDGLDEVKRWTAAKSRSVSPPGVTGPAFVTARWRDREDVRRLPPVAFFPYHWSRMVEGKPPWPSESYAVHHWAAGWKFPEPRIPVRAATEGPLPRQAEKVATRTPLSILVAFRDTDGTRTHLWDFIRAKLERELPEAEIIVASDDGEDPFHKTLAINRAARDATGDVLAIWDADTWVLPERVRRAAAFVAEHPERWCRPWNTKLKLNAEATAHVLSLGEAWDGTIDHKPFGRPEGRNPFWAAPPLLLHRSAFDAVGGMEERFVGWGGEDVAFAHALNRLVGKPRVLPSICIHLHHARVERSGADLWPGQDDRTANAELLTRYVKANRPELMRELVSERTVSV